MRFDGLVIGAGMFLAVSLMLAAWRFWLGALVARHAWLRKVLWALVLGPPALLVAWPIAMGNPGLLAAALAYLTGISVTEGMARLGWIDPFMPGADMQSYPLIQVGIIISSFFPLKWLLEWLAG